MLRHLSRAKLTRGHTFATAASATPRIPLRAGEAIMFERKEAFHVERLKPPMNTRKMVEARGRGPFAATCVEIKIYGAF